MRDLQELPPDLPVPEDDGAAEHLEGARVPRIELPTTDGRGIDLAEAAQRPLVVPYALASDAREVIEWLAARR